jgi:transposase-like protein
MGEPRGRTRYDREFKEGAVRLILEGGRTVRGVAMDLGIHENMLHWWKQEYLEEDRAILKKALAIFSKRPK